MLIMELPAYKRPLVRVVVRHMWDRSKLFLRRAGTVILGINILLWFLATYPKNPQVDQAFARRRTEIADPGLRPLPEAQRAQLDELSKAEAGEKLRSSFA